MGQLTWGILLLLADMAPGGGPASRRRSRSFRAAGEARRSRFAELRFAAQGAFVEWRQIDKHRNLVYTTSSNIRHGSSEREGT